MDQQQLGPDVEVGGGVRRPRADELVEDIGPSVEVGDGVVRDATTVEPPAAAVTGPDEAGQPGGDVHTLTQEEP